MWGLVVAAFASGQVWIFVALVLGLGWVAVLEYFQLLKATGTPHQGVWGRMVCLGYLLGLGLLAGLDAWHWAQLFFFGGCFAAAIGTFCAALRRSIEGGKTLSEVGTTLMGFGYLGALFGMSFFVLFSDWRLAAAGGVFSVAEPDFARVPGAWLALYLIAVTKFSDMGAYLTGSLVGRHKMIPHISPGKTWEGFAGAMVFSVLAGAGFYLWRGDQLFGLEGWVELVVLSLVISVFAVLGDLAGSVIKRCLTAKDAGQVLPGIGGIFDLVDSICFTSPVLVMYLWMKSMM